VSLLRFVASALFLVVHILPSFASLYVCWHIFPDLDGWIRVAGRPASSHDLLTGGEDLLPLQFPVLILSPHLPGDNTFRRCQLSSCQDSTSSARFQTFSRETIYKYLFLSDNISTERNRTPQEA